MEKVSQERFLIERLIRIPDKDGKDADFVFFPEQARLDRELTGRDIIAKCRQRGFSTYFLARSFIRCLYLRNRKCVILAHEVEAAQKLLARIHYMIKHLKTGRDAPPDIKHLNQNFISFNKTDSSIYVGTAGSDDYGVGDTITDLHCTEVSRWRNPDAILTGLFQAVPASGNIGIESTGRGTGNWFHRACMAAARGQGYKLHFFSWLEADEYCLPLSQAEADFIMANLDKSTKEDRYVEEFKLTAGQIAWRRRKLAELNHNLKSFMENYPCDLAECFQSTGNGLFDSVNFSESDDWRAIDPWSYKLGEHPIPGRSYSLGADPAGGVGLDNSAIEVCDSETGEQVFEYANNQIPPEEFALKVVQIARWFNEAFIVPERNNHGYLVISKILDTGYPTANIFRSKVSMSPPKLGDGPQIRRLADYGVYSNETMKAIIVGNLRETIRDEVLIHSPLLKLELSTFVEKPSGRLEAEVGCLDDRVIAQALSVYGRPKSIKVGTDARMRAAIAGAREDVDPFSFDNIQKELIKRYGNSSGDGALPISSGVA